MYFNAMSDWIMLEICDNIYAIYHWKKYEVEEGSDQNCVITCNMEDSEAAWERV